MVMELKVTPWMGEIPPTEEKLRHLLGEQNLKAYQWSNEPHDILTSHTHGYHKVLYVVSGSIKFDFPTLSQNLTAKTGDRLDLPSGIRHNAVVGPSGVTCLEGHIL